MRNSHHAGSSSGGKRDAWDDEFILKRQFSALIPAFDPRPGRTNVNQTSDIEIPPPPGDMDIMDECCPVPSSGPSTAPMIGDVKSDGGQQSPRIHLSLRGPGLAGVSDVSLELTDPSWTMFRAVQMLMQMSDLPNQQDKLKRIWEPTYTYVFVS